MRMSSALLYKIWLGVAKIAKCIYMTISTFPIPFKGCLSLSVAFTLCLHVKVTRTQITKRSYAQLEETRRLWNEPLSSTDFNIPTRPLNDRVL
jgi:hypothetical protein